VIIISVDRDELAEITVENGTSGDQLNVIGRRVVVRVDPDDLDARLAISFHEAATADVEEDLVQLGKGDGVDRAEAIGRRLEFANRIAWHRSVAKVENQKKFWDSDFIGMQSIFGEK